MFDPYLCVLALAHMVVQVQSHVAVSQDYDVASEGGNFDEGIV